MKNLRWLLFILAIFLIAGCRQNAADMIVGNWKVDPSSVKLPNLSAQLSEIIKSGSLNFGKDKTFSLNFQQSITGTYEVHDLSVTMTTVAIQGQPLAKLEALDQRISKLATIQATLSPDFKSLTMDSGGASTTFHKSN